MTWPTIINDKMC